MNQDFVIGEYEEQREAWKDAHDEAMAACDVQELIEKGIAFFGMIRLADESWTRKVQSGAVAFSAERVRSIKSQYQWWLNPCPMVLDMLARAEQSLYQIENGAYFRRCVNLARRLALVDVDGLIEAASQVANNEIEPYDGEVSSALSNPVDEKSKG